MCGQLQHIPSISWSINRKKLNFQQWVNICFTLKSCESLFSLGPISEISFRNMITNCLKNEKILQ